MKKHIIAGVLTLALGVIGAPAEAETIKLFYNIFGWQPSAIKPAGPARIIAGPIRKGQTFFQLDLTYIRTGVLIHDLILPPTSAGTPNVYDLQAGTVFYALGSGEYATWCAVPETHYKVSCFAHDLNGYYWAADVPPRIGLKRAFDIKGQQYVIKLGPEPLINESKPMPSITETLEISIDEFRAAYLRGRRGPLYFKIVSGRTGLGGEWTREPGLYTRMFNMKYLKKGLIDIYAPEGPGVRLRQMETPEGDFVAEALPPLKN